VGTVCLDRIIDHFDGKRSSAALFLSLENLELFGIKGDKFLLPKVYLIQPNHGIKINHGPFLMSFVSQKSLTLHHILIHKDIETGNAQLLKKEHKKFRELETLAYGPSYFTLSPNGSARKSLEDVVQEICSEHKLSSIIINDALLPTSISDGFAKKGIKVDRGGDLIVESLRLDRVLENAEVSAYKQAIQIAFDGISCIRSCIESMVGSDSFTELDMYKTIKSYVDGVESAKLVHVIIQTTDIHPRSFHDEKLVALNKKNPVVKIDIGVVTTFNGYRGIADISDTLFFPDAFLEQSPKTQQRYMKLLLLYDLCRQFVIELAHFLREGQAAEDIYFFAKQLFQKKIFARTNNKANNNSPGSIEPKCRALDSRLC